MSAFSHFSYGIGNHISDNIPAVLLILDALVPIFDKSPDNLEAPASLAHSHHTFAVHPTSHAHHSTTARISDISQTGSFSNVFFSSSHHPYLCFSTSLPSLVKIRSFSIFTVSSGFVIHLAIALTVFRVDPGTFFSIVQKLKASSSPSSKSHICCTWSSNSSKTLPIGFNRFRTLLSHPSGSFRPNHSPRYHHPPAHCPISRRALLASKLYPASLYWSILL